MERNFKDLTDDCNFMMTELSSCLKDGNHASRWKRERGAGIREESERSDRYRSTTLVTFRSHQSCALRSPSVDLSRRNSSGPLRHSERKPITAERYLSNLKNMKSPEKGYKAGPKQTLTSIEYQSTIRVDPGAIIKEEKTWQSETSREQAQEDEM